MPDRSLQFRLLLLICPQHRELCSYPRASDFGGIGKIRELHRGVVVMEQRGYRDQQRSKDLHTLCLLSLRHMANTQNGLAGQCMHHDTW